MKKFDLPLWTDTLFLFAGTTLFFLCVFRFALSFGAALALAAAAGLAAAVLFFLWLKRRRGRRAASAGERRAIEQFAFRLAMQTRERNAELIAESLNAAPDAGLPAADEEPDAAGGGEEAAAPAGQGGPARSEPQPKARAENGRVVTQTGELFPLFRFEKVTADELCPVLRADAARKTVLAGAYTEEAQKLAAAFGVELKDAADAYALVKAAGKLPDGPALPAAKGGAFGRLRLRVRRGAWKGYLLAGAGLLLFSLISVFPVYYVVAGSLLLAAAIFVRVFGKA